MAPPAHINEGDTMPGASMLWALVSSGTAAQNIAVVTSRPLVNLAGHAWLTLFTGPSLIDLLARLLPEQAPSFVPRALSAGSIAVNELAWLMLTTGASLAAVGLMARRVRSRQDGFESEVVATTGA